VSLPLQNKPSSQGELFGVAEQPLFMSQLSSVQILPSSQSVGGPGWQIPPLQLSLLVQALPSSQPPAVLEWSQVPVGRQMSLVQALPSSQLALFPWQPPWPVQTPSSHWSGSSPGLPLSQVAVLVALAQPDAGRHWSSVHGLPSSQSSAGPGPQLPPAQVSPTVQALPSSQAAVLGGCRQAPSPSQASSVQGLPSSSQIVPAAPALQSDEQQSPALLLPSSQVSPHAASTIPSTQVLPAGMQLPVESQLSAGVQGSPSSQARPLF
jgi:hypothetical protein